MADKPKPKLTVELEPGRYLVSVHPAYGVRVWKGDGLGVYTGHGGKIRRIAIDDALRELTIAAEKADGTWPGLEKS